MIILLLPAAAVYPTKSPVLLTQTAQLVVNAVELTFIVPADGVINTFAIFIFLYK
jgi:hypothetical protein